MRLWRSPGQGHRFVAVAQRMCCSATSGLGGPTLFSAKRRAPHATDRFAPYPQPLTFKSVSRVKEQARDSDAEGNSLESTTVAVLVASSTASAVRESAQKFIAESKKKLYAVYRPTQGAAPSDFVAALSKLQEHRLGELAKATFLIFMELLEKQLHPALGGGTPWDMGARTELEMVSVAVSKVMLSVGPREAFEFVSTHLLPPVTPTTGDGGLAAAQIESDYGRFVSAIVEAMERRQSGDAVGFPLPESLRSALTTAPVVGSTAAALIRLGGRETTGKAIGLLETAALARLRGVASFDERAATLAAEAAAMMGDAETVTRITFILYRSMGALGVAQELSEVRSGDRQLPHTRTKTHVGAMASFYKRFWAIPEPERSRSADVCAGYLGSSGVTEAGTAGAESSSMSGAGEGAHGSMGEGFELAVARLLRSVIHASLSGLSHRTLGVHSVQADHLALNDAMCLFHSLRRGCSWHAVSAMAMELLDFTASRSNMFLEADAVLRALQPTASRRVELPESQRAILSLAGLRVMEAYVPARLRLAAKGEKVSWQCPVMPLSAPTSSAARILELFEQLGHAQRCGHFAVSIALAAAAAIGDVERATTIVMDFIAVNRMTAKDSQGRLSEQQLLGALSSSGGLDNVLGAQLLESAILSGDLAEVGNLFAHASGAQLAILWQLLRYRPSLPTSMMEAVAFGMSQAIRSGAASGAAELEDLLMAAAHQHWKPQALSPTVLSLFSTVFSHLTGMTLRVLTPLQLLHESSIRPTEEISEGRCATSGAVGPASATMVAVVDESVVRHALQGRVCLPALVAEVCAGHTEKIFVLPWRTVVELARATRGGIGGEGDDVEAGDFLRMMALGKAFAIVPCDAPRLCSTEAIAAEADSGGRVSEVLALAAARDSIGSTDVTLAYWIEPEPGDDVEGIVKGYSDVLRDRRVSILSRRRLQLQKTYAALRHLLPLTGAVVKPTTVARRGADTNGPPGRGDTRARSPSPERSRRPSDVAVGPQPRSQPRQPCDVS